MLENDCYLTDKKQPMKKIISFLAIILLLVSCKEEVEKPNRLIEKDVMVNIIYDLSLLEAIKYQNPASLDTFKINPTKYIYNKYKIDSLQFAQNNTYYASTYEEYANIIDQINNRLIKNKAELTELIKTENEKRKLVGKPASTTGK